MVHVRGLTQKTIFVSVTKIELDLAKAGISLPLEKYSYGNWLLGTKLRKANQCEWLAAVSKAHIVGIWKINKTYGWQPMQRGMNPAVVEPINPNRKQCRFVKLSEEDVKPFVGQYVRLYFPFDFNF